jgi:hypothetical protein
VGLFEYFRHVYGKDDSIKFQKVICFFEAKILIQNDYLGTTKFCDEYGCIFHRTFYVTNQRSS